ncbi:hypothetical protein B296_00007490 [Ensete ventricosum]|uniref:Uncharacterized protein n=1 Tax=Ensete ventricosum TaxID=4639 RepID=A0A426XSM6_ENSVE|nr:hypothetical protein B296_00007490 [Ensete ventricosum]
MQQPATYASWPTVAGGQPTTIIGRSVGKQTTPWPAGDRPTRDLHGRHHRWPPAWLLVQDAAPTGAGASGSLRIQAGCCLYTRRHPTLPMREAVATSR